MSDCSAEAVGGGDATDAIVGAWIRNREQSIAVLIPQDDVLEVALCNCVNRGELRAVIEQRPLNGTNNSMLLLFSLGRQGIGRRAIPFAA